MFSSLSYEDRDIEPTIREYLECRHGDIPEGDGRDDCYNCAPRWIEHPQTASPANRVLVHIRKRWEGLAPSTKRVLVKIHLSIIRGHLEEHAGLDGYCRYTPDTIAMMQHARRVLLKLDAAGA